MCSLDTPTGTSAESPSLCGALAGTCWEALLSLLPRPPRSDVCLVDRSSGVALADLWFRSRSTRTNGLPEIPSSAANGLAECWGAARGGRSSSPEPVSGLAWSARTRPGLDPWGTFGNFGACGSCWGASELPRWRLSSAMTPCTTRSWSRDRCRCRVTAQNSFLSSAEASMASSWQQTMPARGDRPSRSCFSLCFAASCVTMAASRTVFSLDRRGLGLLFLCACRWFFLSRSETKPSHAFSRARLSPVEKGRSGRLEGLDSDAPTMVDAERGSSMGMCDE